jgi:hypothetical protein
MLPEEQEHIYEQLLEFERTEYVSPPMRELIQNAWPGLAQEGLSDQDRGRQNPGAGRLKRTVVPRCRVSLRLTLVGASWRTVNAVS